MWEFASVVAFLDSFEGDLKLHSFNLSVPPPSVFSSFPSSLAGV
jgi:hypothetical protein